MSEVMTTETKKRKFSLIDNFVVILLVGYLLLGVGGRLGAELLVRPLHAWLARVMPDIAATDAWITASVYLRFLGIWIAVLLFLAIIPRNRPLLKALTTKTKGNTLKMFAVGLGIGLGMNLLCAFVAMLLINIFALKISSITLMLVGAAVSLLIFLSKGGAKK